MEKKPNSLEFLSAIQKKFRIDFTKMNEIELVEFCNKLIDSKSYCDSLLFSITCFHNDSPLPLIHTLKSFSGFNGLKFREINESLGKPQSNGYDIFSDEEDFNEKILNQIIKYPFNTVSLLRIMFVKSIVGSEKRKLPENHVLCVIADMYCFFIEHNSKGILILRKLLFEVNSIYTQLKLTKIKLLLRTIIKELLIGGDKKTIYSFWIYNVYTNNKEMMDVMLEIFSNDSYDLSEDNLSLKNIAFPYYSTEQIQYRYERILEIQEGSANENKRRHFLNKIHEASIHSLIPSILHARSLDNVEAESMLLWYAFRQENSEFIITRMSELSGYQVPEDVRIVHRKKTMGLWFKNRLSEYKDVYRSNSISDDKVLLVKKIYTIQPFSTKVLSALFRIEVIHSDTESRNMIDCSISRMSSKFSLSKLLCLAISTKSRYAFKSVLSRLSLLEEYETIVNSLNKSIEFIEHNDKQKLDFISSSIKFYESIVSDSVINKFGFRELKEKFRNIKSNFKDLFSSEEKILLQKEKEIFVSLQHDKNDYLLKVLADEKSYTTTVLEAVLKIAIKSGKVLDIVSAYKLLASRDKARASFYNTEIEPYIITYNVRIRKSKEFTTSKGLTSVIWSMPVALENPVNKTAVRVAFPYAK